MQRVYSMKKQVQQRLENVTKHYTMMADLVVKWVATRISSSITPYFAQHPGESCFTHVTGDTRVQATEFCFYYIYIYI
jgi:hypothetical protein